MTPKSIPSKQTAKYFKIETLGAVDGPGIRLVIFLCGCPWRCIYCHNPESWHLNEFNTITVDEVITNYKKNKSFYKNGGITLSGGEPLLQMDFCLLLAKRCLQEKIHLSIDTSGSCWTNAAIKKLCDLKVFWLVDIKHTNMQWHKKITGYKDINELKLIKLLEKYKSSYIIRVVIVPRYTDQIDNLKKIGKFIKTLQYMKNLELLPVHTLALHKYKELNIDYKIKNIKSPSASDIKRIKNIIVNA